MSSLSELSAPREPVIRPRPDPKRCGLAVLGSYSLEKGYCDPGADIASSDPLSEASPGLVGGPTKPGGSGVQPLVPQPCGPDLNLVETVFAKLAALVRNVDKRSIEA